MEIFSKILFSDNKKEKIRTGKTALGENKMTEKKISKEEMVDISKQLEQIQNDPNVTLVGGHVCNTSVDPIVVEPITATQKTINIPADKEEKRCTSLKDIISYFAKWAIAQSPYPCPDNLEKIVNYLDTKLRENYNWQRLGDFIYQDLSLKDIKNMLKETLEPYELFMEWNSPKKGSHTIMFVSAYDGPRNPDYDFIDLDALYNNVSISIRDDRRKNDRFCEEFEAQYEGSTQK